MPTMKSFIYLSLSLGIVFSLAASTLSLGTAHAQGTDGLARQVNAQTSKLSFLAPQGKAALPAAQAMAGISLTERRANPALALLKRYGAEFGLQDPERELVEKSSSQLEDGRLAVRYQQTYRGIPVMGGELVVNTNADVDLYSINGEVAAELNLSVEPGIDPAQAQESARQAVAKWYGIPSVELSVSEPELWILDPSLITPYARPAELVWRMEVTAIDELLPVRELVLINAQRGHISLHFNQIDTTWTSNRLGRASSPSGLPSRTNEDPGLAAFNADVATYTAGNGTNLPGQFLCDETRASCTSGADLHADRAHTYAIGTFNLFANQHGRNSIDGQGMQLISTVHYDVDYGNAFWSGSQMVYGDGYGFALADDVVAHELTHGVTQHASNLFYFYQSGAINESFSDIWGEFYDQTNAQGNDADAVKWQIGEEISALGAIRNMQDPTLFDNPDKMSSQLYAQDEFDNGGVHTNSGIGNKAAYLMVNGGSFNGKTITAVGWEKTAAIYYEANTNLLSSGADYSDLYFALQRACTTLIGQKGITSANCVEVKDAIDAVEMNGQPVPNFNTDVPLCGAGVAANTLFSDSLESGTGNWTFNNGAFTRWQVDSVDGSYAHSGIHSLYADDLPEATTDATARLKVLTIPGNAYLHFSHAYLFESLLGFYDGGVLEYSLNAGSTWHDAGSLMDFNGYRGTIEAGLDNPLEGRLAFIGSSHGYISTRLNLASLAGQTVSFRWRMGLASFGLGDLFGWPSGWWLDDVRLYTCGSAPGAFNKTSPADNATGVGLTTTLSWSSSPSASYYQYCYDIINDNQCNRTWSPPVNVTSAQISNLGTNTQYFWQVRAVNAIGTTGANGQSWGTFTTTSVLPPGTASLDAFIAGVRRGRYSLGSGQSLRENYLGVNNGPVRLVSNSPFIGAERVIYKVNNINTSYSEMMGSPNGQLDTIHWLPWYNNVDLDSQLRIANAGTQTGSVRIFIGGQEMQGSPFHLAAGASTRRSFSGINNGPVKIVSNVNIVAAERVIYKVNNVNTSFSETMALPNKNLNTIYWLPGYDNLNMDSQLRIASVTLQPATVKIYIGGQLREAFQLPAGGSTRRSYAVNGGPVRIESTQPIVAAERVIYKHNSVPTSFSEMMALPSSQVNSTFWLPWYNNVDLATQFRIANTGGAAATVRVYVGGAEVGGSPFTVGSGASLSKSFAGINNGPVRIVGTQPIVVSEQVIYRVNNIPVSFSEIMGVPSSLLGTIYWLPWYNNVDLDTQLRFGVP